MKQFTVAIEDHLPEKRTLIVKTYDTVKQLQRAHKREAQKLYENVVMEDIVGVFSGLERWKVSKDGPDIRMPDAGMVRLCRQFNGQSIVVHELVHVASHLYGAYFVEETGEKALAETHFVGDNEQLAHLMGELFHKVNLKLHEIGFYEDYHE